MVLKGAIFDLDGVIVDTVKLHFKAWKKMFTEHNKEFDFEDYKSKVDGIPRVDGAKAILEDLSEQEIEEAAAKKQNYFLEFIEDDKVKVYEETLNLIDSLKSQGVKIAAISSSKSCRYILDKVNLIDKFQVIIAGNEVKKGKPDPDIFLMASKQLGLDPKECLVFEDATLGVEAAKRAKMKCIGIDRHGDKMRLAKADLVVSDLGQLNSKKLEELFK